MTIEIRINEAHLGPFAGRQQALDVIDDLRRRGWPADYTVDPHDGQWRFDTFRQYQQFERAFERVMDSNSASVSVSWGCQCTGRDCDERCTCPAPDVDQDQEAPAAIDEETAEALKNLYGYELECVVEMFYPGLGEWIRLNISSLYGALAWGLLWQKATGTESAAGLWLNRSWHRPEGKLRTYDEHLGDFARFLAFAVDDAWMSEEMARARIRLEELKRCPECGDWLTPYCVCDWCHDCGMEPANCKCKGGEAVQS